MLYQNYLKKLKICPFCHLIGDEIIKQNNSAMLVLARAPYTNTHLLVVPKKHYSKLISMSIKEKEDIEKLIYYGMEKLHKKYKNVTILYREGNKKEVGKSINHLHYHLIPDLKIGSHDVHWKERKIFSEEEYIKKIKELKKALFS
ncbi:MAG: HIT family protein [Candidatus Pacearchaeota archaeon]|jgi:diadenosine tetraphosphate (Ap4A) HIT family hydrolase